MADFFVELAFVLIAVFAISYIMILLKQPLLVGYIITGLLAGPMFLNILSSTQEYETFSHIGVALLLFIVGLHLNLRLIKDVGFISVITGLGQIIFTTIVGYIMNVFLGFDIIPALLIAISLTFSSTIIIVKLLNDLQAMDKLFGKISIGFLLVQDIVAVIFLMVIGSLYAPSSQQSLHEIIFYAIGVGVIAVITTFLFAKYILPKFLEKISRSKELLFIFVFSWCLGISAVFGLFGFSIEIGALLAGVALASTKYQHEISAKIRPVRDFFIIMFFIFLGSQLIPEMPGSSEMNFTERMDHIHNSMSPIFYKAIILSLFVLIGNPLIVLLLVLAFGYSAKTGFLAGLTVSQISEFSFIFMLLAHSVGLVSIQDVSLVTFIAIFTIICSTYLVMNGEKLYKLLHPFLSKLERKSLKDSLQGIQGEKHDVILFGSNRIGYSLVKSFEKLQKSVLIVDHDPKIVNEFLQQGLSAVYGDASNIEFISEFDFQHAKIIVSTIPDFEANELLIQNIRDSNKHTQIIVTANTIDDALQLYEIGADYVILPHFLGGHYVSTLIEDFEGDVQRLIKEKITHITELKQRKNLGHTHPNT